MDFIFSFDPVQNLKVVNNSDDKIFIEFSLQPKRKLSYYEKW